MVERNKQIEIFLFINPISESSFKMEKEVLKFIGIYEKDAQMSILPYHNPQTLFNYMQRNQMPTQSTQLWNTLQNDIYHVSLAYIAATIQGKKKGRNFLMDVQEQIVDQDKPLSKKLLIEAAKKARLDIEMFLSDFHSSFTQSLFHLDQEVSKTMGATDTPTCVLVTTGEEKTTTLIESSITAEDLCQMV